MGDGDGLILQSVQGKVLLITLNRPERHHALNGELSGALEAAIRDAGGLGASVIVITGSGEKAFCAGADMLEVSGVRERTEGTGDPGTALKAVASTPLPIIAAINGYCYGAGAAMAVNCDLRLASQTATFRFPGSEYGLVVAAAGLAPIVGAARAKDIIFTARRFTAEEALAWGFVSSLHRPEELLPAALALAESIASHSAAAVQAAKRVIDAATSSAAALALEAEVNQSLRGTSDQVDRFRAATKRVTGE